MYAYNGYNYGVQATNTTTSPTATSPTSTTASTTATTPNTNTPYYNYNAVPPPSSQTSKI